MNKKDVMEKLTKAFLEDLYLDDVTEEDFTETTVLFGDGLGLDSIDAVEIVMLVEKHFGVVIKDADEAKDSFASFGDLADFIVARLAQLAG